MHINANDTIRDINILSIRNFLRTSAQLQRWRVDYVASFLKSDGEKSCELLDEFEKRDYVEKDELRDGEQCWHNTVSGNSLGAASAAKPYKRKTAEKALAGFLKRIQTVNSNPYYLYKVTRVILFGSYLTDVPDVNDVDIALGIAPKEKNPELRSSQLEKRRTELAKSGKRFNSVVKWVGAAEIEVWNFLKSHSRIISVHLAIKELFDLAGGKVVFDETQESHSF